ncbi:transporter [Lachnospiraceae bacterium LCP25S3_G4]
MKKYAVALLKRMSTTLELFISLLLGVAITLLSIKLALGVFNVPNLNVYPNYEDLLSTCLNLVIGVELIRMLYTHTPSTVFEVLLFAIARQIITEHSSAMNSLIGVIAIGILFATRKFLFIDFDESEKIIFRATQKVHNVNKLLHVAIPHHDNQTLADVIVEKLQESKDEVGVGACAYYQELGLRIAKMRDGKITRIEVIRAIH